MQVSKSFVSRAGGHGVKLASAASTFETSRESRLTLLSQLLAKKKQLAQQSDVNSRSTGPPPTPCKLPCSDSLRLSVSPKRQRSDDMIPTWEATNKKRKATEGSSDRDVGKRKTTDEVSIIFFSLHSNANGNLLSYQVVRPL
jgi:hypothetical protein